MKLSPAVAKKIVKQALKAATLPEVQVELMAKTTGNLRIADNQALTSGDVDSLRITITASDGQRSASVTGTNPQSITNLVSQAEALCQASPIDPEHMPLLPPQSYVQTQDEDPATKELSAEERAKLGASLIRVANRQKVFCAAFVEHHGQAHVLANSAGLFAYHPSSYIDMSMTCRSRDGNGSGWAAGASHRVADLDPESIAQKAAEKALASREPKEIQPGKYTVILEPQAVADILAYLLSGLSARDADEGRSYFAKPNGGTLLGETVFAPEITLFSDPSHPQHPSSPLTQEGLPLTQQRWVEQGTVKSLMYSRYWAKKQNASPTGWPNSLFLVGKTASLEELIAQVDRGILVTRFWYNRLVDPQSLLVTGLTRDGTFLIENGQITTSCKNMRYNESPARMLKNVIALGRIQRVLAGNGMAVAVPPLVVRDFHFTSMSDSI